jgi:hypothetical protein
VHEVTASVFSSVSGVSSSVNHGAQHTLSEAWLLARNEAAAQWYCSPSHTESARVRILLGALNLIPFFLFFLLFVSENFEIWILFKVFKTALLQIHFGQTICPFRSEKHALSNHLICFNF